MHSSYPGPPPITGGGVSTSFQGSWSGLDAASPLAVILTSVRLPNGRRVAVGGEFSAQNHASGAQMMRKIPSEAHSVLPRRRSISRDGKFFPHRGHFP